MTCNLFTFRDDSFHPETESSFLDGDMPKADDQDDALASIGYSKSQIVGDDSGLHYELFEHDSRGWVVVFSTASRFCLVACRTWPDLISLTFKLSAIALGGLILTDDRRDAHLPTSPVRER